MRTTFTVVLGGALLFAGPPMLDAGCVPGPNYLCLGGFGVEVDWEDPSLVTGQGEVLLEGSDWGLFYFEDSRYLELAVHVLNGCDINGNYWVFASGLSDYQQTITITDFVTGGGPVVYDNPAGEFFYLADTNAISCPTMKRDGRHVSEETENGMPLGLSLVGDRFRAELSWKDFVANEGDGQPVVVTSHSGYFWLFDAANPSVFVKIFDGSADNGFFHVLWGAMTNVELALRVTDLCDGTQRTYFKSLGQPAETVADTTAFRCEIFADGFESGDTSAWK